MAKKCKQGYVWCNKTNRCIPDDEKKRQGRLQGRGDGKGPMGKPVKESKKLIYATKLMDVILDEKYEEFKRAKKAVIALNSLMEKLENEINHVPNQDGDELLDDVKNELSGERDDEITEGLKYVLETEYDDYFKGMLKRFNINSPNELNDKEKKAFFKALKLGWKNKKENKK